MDEVLVGDILETQTIPSQPRVASYGIAIALQEMT
jgi:hypothetical protein